MINDDISEIEFEGTVNKISWIAIVINILLAAFKMITGIVAHSNAMISDAVHSVSDVFSTLVVILGVKMASKDPDKEHPYGHERFECVAAMILAMILFITGASIGLSALKEIVAGEYSNIEVPGSLALVAAIISVLVKEWMY